jgi:hypothetical protein
MSGSYIKTSNYLYGYLSFNSVKFPYIAYVSQSRQLTKPFACKIKYVILTFITCSMTNNHRQ